MQDEKKLNAALEKFYQRYNRYNTKVLQKLGETIKQFDGIRPSDAHRIAQQLKYGTDIDELLAELVKITEKSNVDLIELLEKAAEDNVEFAEVYEKATNKKIDKSQIDDIVKAISKQTTGTMANISNTRAIGFTFKKGDKTIFKPLKKAYNDLIDEAVFNVVTGQQNYQSSMSGIMKQLADSGVKVHESKVNYESGYNRRIDSSVRQTVLDGVKQVNIQIQENIGDQLGADGIEVSAHTLCAEDHIDIQGRQYTKKQFERVNSNLKRQIGHYNCRHFIFSIIMGVNLPSYTQKQLNEYKTESRKLVSYEGKTYTKYEATQVQRQLETKIRQQKDRQIIARASGENSEVEKAQKNISKYTYKYYDFSQKAGLDTYKNRLVVSGYRKVKVNK